MLDEMTVLHRIAPDLMADIGRRAQVLSSIESMQPVGRRALAARLNLPEREVRAAAAALKEQGLISMDAAGMQLTPQAIEVLAGAHDLSRAMFGLTKLEQTLSQLLSVPHVIVVSGNADSDPQVLREVGRAAAHRVHKLLQSGMTLAVTGGRTMSEMAHGMQAASPMNVMVVPARGGVGSSVETQASAVAAEIAKRIGADVMLVRTGALYHDIGKMENPAFFTENQAGFNPHDKISEKESAKVIISHVTYGQRLAENYHLPDIIKDFILTHHGKGITSFFYIKYKNAHPDEEVDISDFSYPGPNPQTKEQAILMMADTVEAATKALDEYNDENISKRVNELIDKQVNDGYFRECPITFRDIAMAKQVLIERLKSIYHTRIKYPELKTKENDEDLLSNNSDNTDNLGFWGNLD